MIKLIRLRRDVILHEEGLHLPAGCIVRAKKFPNHGLSIYAFDYEGIRIWRAWDAVEEIDGLSA